MLVGIDVGGTFTDAVAVRAGTVVATAKVPTRAEDLAFSLLAALDGVLGRVSPGEVARVSLSTTLITNLLAQGHASRVATLLIPGPGRDPGTYRLPGKYWIVGGAIDFRGREVVAVDRAEVLVALEEIRAAGYRHLAVVGKFSPRNPVHEEQVLTWATARRAYGVRTAQLSPSCGSNGLDPGNRGALPRLFGPTVAGLCRSRHSVSDSDIKGGWGYAPTGGR